MKGSCLCGGVRFEVEPFEQNLYRCFCSLCRKQSGVTSNAATIVESDQFRWLTGESLIKKFSLQSGFTSHFCGTCGSPVPNPLRDTGRYWVPAGALDDAVDARFVSHICVSDKASWDEDSEDCEHHSHMPGLEEHIACLKK